MGLAVFMAWRGYGVYSLIVPAIFAAALEALGATQRFEWVLIDCPPSLGLLTVNALTAANEVLSVVGFVDAGREAHGINFVKQAYYLDDAGVRRIVHLSVLGVSEDPQIGDTLQVNAYVGLHNLTPNDVAACWND